MTARLFTASWTSLWQASKRRPLPVQPVRTSRGLPKFWPAAERFPAVDELMPDGWMLGSTDRGKNERAYRYKLGQIGLERIAARLDEIADECGGLPLCLCCFEAAASDCHRSWAAEWLHEQTGLVVPEIGWREGSIDGPDPATGQNAHGDLAGFAARKEPR